MGMIKHFKDDRDEEFHNDEGADLGTVFPEALLHVRCTCGKELKIIAEGWKVNFLKHLEMTCPCGKMYETKEVLN